MLAAAGIAKTFAGRQVWRDINLAVCPGEIVAVRGPSGSGKTTLLRAMALVDPPDTGCVEIDRTRYEFPRDRALKLTPWPALTVVFQQHFLWPHLTLRENILLPVRAGSGTKTAEFDRLTSVLSMAPFLSRYPNEVSAGERQRAAIARAVLLNPRYLLLDEVTSFLDEIQRTALAQLLLNLKSRGVGIILITHDVSFAAAVADETYFMPTVAIGTGNGDGHPAKK